jgi:capsular polysaccharide biosynthesis protein
MNDQALDLKGALRAVWRHKIIVTIVAVLGLCLGAAYGVVHPRMLTSTALVVLAPNTHDASTQVVIAGSDPVLSRALPHISPATTVTNLHTLVSVKNPTPGIIAISAEGKTATEAEDTANAIANSYVAYVTSKASASEPVETQAKVLEPAVTATGRSMFDTVATTGALGLLGGVLIGAIGVLAIDRGDRRLRQRDEIANALGVPVLASLPVAHPSDPARWTKLLEEYLPSVVHAWQLRTALAYLGQASAISANSGNGGGFSVAVLSLSSDRRALALGPQLAVFAASLGIPTALVIGPQQEPGVTAALRSACAEPPPSSSRPAQLMVTVADHNDMPRIRGIRLTVVVGVVDSGNPNVAETMRASTTVLGVSAGGATAAQMVGVAVSATTDGRQIEGILVADPDPADRTTGRVPQLTRPALRGGPTRLTGTTTEIRR